MVSNRPCLVEIFDLLPAYNEFWQSKESSTDGGVFCCLMRTVRLLKLLCGTLSPVLEGDRGGRGGTAVAG